MGCGWCAAEIVLLRSRGMVAFGVGRLGAYLVRLGVRSKTGIVTYCGGSWVSGVLMSLVVVSVLSGTRGSIYTRACRRRGLVWLNGGVGDC
ncbi:hypothetical protein F4780DRAFT_722507 [Xylariomycetidae sp. FL0641]|nr:hypothetical protein F4780DRAFT_722507 [Xylariomycetidae sp. FL0641]